MKKLITLSILLTAVSVTSHAAQICGPLSQSAKTPDCKKGQACSGAMEEVFQVQSAGGEKYDLVMKSIAKLQAVQALVGDSVVVTGKDTTEADDQDQDFQVTSIVKGFCPRGPGAMTADAAAVSPVTEFATEYATQYTCTNGKEAEDGARVSIVNGNDGKVYVESLGNKGGPVYTLVTGNPHQIGLVKLKGKSVAVTISDRIAEGATTVKFQGAPLYSCSEVNTSKK